MTAEERIVDLLAEGVSSLPELERALKRDGIRTDRLTDILSDLTEQDFAEVTNLHGKNVARDGDRILDFDGLTLALTPAGIKRWMMEDAAREE